MGGGGGAGGGGGGGGALVIVNSGRVKEKNLEAKKEEKFVNSDGIQ